MTTLLASAMYLLATGFFFTNEPVVNMRENPTHESGVASQTYYSEEIRVENNDGEWSLIRTPDGYTGWVLSKCIINLPHPYETQLSTSRLAAHVYGIDDTEWGPIKTLPYGSKLQALDTSNARWIKIALLDGKECYIQKGDVAPESKLTTRDELVEFSKKFLGLPYTWGGRTSFGFDCSGFVQMLYRQIGINLPRDSKQQVLDNRFQTVTLDQLKTGDLIFFGKSQQKITHVGMYIGNNQFIHSTVRENMPWIRISNLSDKEWSGHSESNFPYVTARQFKS